jgi:16S rRNA (guanine527-N7)-methyltransferase
MQSNLLEILESGAELLDIRLSHTAILNLMKYVDLLGSWNTRINLVSYKNPEDLVILHILDSLTLLKVIDCTQSLKILDIGTGAGLPGMVLKIAADQLDVTLVEKNAKRVLFLKETIRVLGLNSIIVINRDYDRLKNANHIEKYDMVMSRAFSSEPHFFMNLTHFVKDGGSFMVMGGPSWDRDFLKIEGFGITAHWEGNLPLSDKSRKVIRYSRIDSSL